jgi:hypothetical protein
VNVHATTELDVLLRDPTLAAQRAITGHHPSLVRTALLSLLVGSAIFGGVLGSYRGELQVAYAALKMPLVLLGALVVTAPALWALGAASGRAWTLRCVGALVVVAAGRAALVLVALAPLLWLAIDLGTGYHFSSFLAAGTFALAGLVALAALVRGLGRSGVLVGICAAVVFLSALAQTGWALRPWLGRPSQPVVWVRTEAGVGPVESVLESTRHGIDDPSGQDFEGWEGGSL